MHDTFARLNYPATVANSRSVGNRLFYLGRRILGQMMITTRGDADQVSTSKKVLDKISSVFRSECEPTDARRKSADGATVAYVPVYTARPLDQTAVCALAEKLWGPRQRSGTVVVVQKPVEVPLIQVDDLSRSLIAFEQTARW